MSSGWRGLGLFWLAVLVLLGSGAAVLQALGPPAPRPVAAISPPKPLPPIPVPPKARVVTAQAPAVPAAERPGRDTPGPVVDPDPALLQPGPDGGMLPQIASDGRMPMQVYAAGFDHTTRRPRIGLVLAGIGLDQAASLAAIRDLPRGITLAVSPYVGKLRNLLEQARFAEHEYLLSLPMEPQSFPLNDPGPRALMTSLTPAQNLHRLHWLLSRVQGYVGVTNALGASLQGQRFTAATEQMTPILRDLAGRGLLFVDAEPGQAQLPRVWNRDVDLVIDDPESGIEAKLAELERIARQKGSALGLATVPRPETVRRLATWANGLEQRGFALAPVSALVQPPTDAKESQ